VYVIFPVISPGIRGEKEHKLRKGVGVFWALLWLTLVRRRLAISWSFVATGRVHQARVGGSFRAFFPPIPQSAAGVCNKMASCSRKLSVSGTARIAHELPIMFVETCSDGVDQYSRCRSTTAHGKPRGTLVLFNAVHHHVCLNASGYRLALVILLCLALFFQAAAQSPPPPQSPGYPYPGLDRQLLYSSYYVYYPINEGNDFFLQFSRWFWEMRTTHIHMCNTCRVHFHLSETRYTLFLLVIQLEGTLD
jgi:hypothetical protein